MAPLALVETHGVDGISVWIGEVPEEEMIEGTFEETTEEKHDVMIAAKKEETIGETIGGMIEEKSLEGDVVHLEDGTKAS